MPDSVDIQHMARALQLAEQGLYSTDPNPRVGCVIVNDGQVIGEGWHRKAGEPHAEVHALRAAGPKARGATAYVTLEPCSHHGRTPPCANALCEAGVARVVMAMRDPNPQVGGAGIERLEAAGIAVDVGTLGAEAEKLNPGFSKRMRQGLPWVHAKIAMSLDGRTAMASGESQWITGPQARADVQRLRARCSAVITGIGTVLADDPSLTVRPEDMGSIGLFAAPGRQPVRVILDSQLQMPAEAKLLSLPGRVVIISSEQALKAAPERQAALQEAGAEVIALAAQGRPSWLAVLKWCGEQAFNEVLVEAGPTLAGSAQAAAIIDELWIYQAFTLLGSEGRPMMTLPLERMAEQQRLTVLDARRLGEDMRYRLGSNNEVGECLPG
ncbi:bifunctional diaminohydroxyphosphoribosylaminopyrimidine deaminase/5-amino-6-(5-phosphoribosylamino)uracil reductase RibD [Marinobacteraceae bacterium S3BR75-40.1]